MSNLVHIENARREIMLANTPNEAMTLENKAEALKAYLRKEEASRDIQNQAAEIALRAHRRVGELLRDMDRHDKIKNLSRGDTVSPREKPTLADIGISKKQSSRRQQVAAIPEPEFEAYIATQKESGEITKAGALRLARVAKRKSIIKPQPIKAALKSPLLIHGKSESTGLENETVDLIITSPPYNLDKSNWPMGGDGRTPRNGIDYDSHDDSMGGDKYIKWQMNVLKELYRVSKGGASLFYNHHVRTQKGEIQHPIAWLSSVDNPWIIRQEIIWDRGSTHNHSASMFWPEDERVYWMTKGKPALPERPIGMSNIWRFHGPRANTWHPAPFADELPKRCIEAVGRDGITVLDPFCGSGTTLKIALDYGYDAIGIDISKKYLKDSAMENGWVYE